MPSFTVTAAGQRVNLDAAGTAKASFTVTNTSPQALRGRLLTRPRNAAKPEWFMVVGEAVRDFAPNGAQQVVVELKVPTGTAPGSYSFRLDAVSEDDPDEDFTEGPSVAFDVAGPPPPKKKFPWWILAIVGAVVLLIIIGVVLWLLLRDTSPTVPNVKGLAQAQATTKLAEADLGVDVRNIGVADPQQDGLVQSQDPAEGTRQPPGTVVRIEVGRNVEVPDVVGLGEPAAIDTIRSVGLRASVIRIQGQPFGIVRNQNPLPGARLPLGGVVTIQVGSFFG